MRVAAALMGVFLSACRSDPPPPAPSSANPNPGPEPVIIDLPPNLMDGKVGRLANPRQAFIYFRSLPLLVFTPEWELRRIVQSTADLLAELSANPAVEGKADYWTVQTDKEYGLEDFRRLVISVTPRQAADAARHRDPYRLWLEADFVKYNDIPHNLSAEERRTLWKDRDLKAIGPLPPTNPLPVPSGP